MWWVLCWREQKGIQMGEAMFIQGSDGQKNGPQGVFWIFLSPISNKIMTSSYLSPLGFTTGTSGEWGGKRVC